MLRRAGSKIDFAGFAGLSPLMVACSTNAVAAAKVLCLICGEMDNQLQLFLPDPSTTNKIVPPEKRCTVGKQCGLKCTSNSYGITLNVFTIFFTCEFTLL